VVIDADRTPGRLLNAEDIVAAIKTLDAAAGADSRYFRYRLRQWLRTEEQLAQRHPVMESRYTA
jgi:hypothetical protein